MAEIPNYLNPEQELLEPSGPQMLGDTPVVSTEGEPTASQLALYDTVNNTVLTTPLSEAEPYLKTGNYTLQKGSRINIVDREGNASSILGNEISQALNSGYRLEMPEETQARKLQEQFGSSADQALAAAAGAARGASFGLSDVALTQSGLVEPETLAGLEEANPVASGVGEVGGVIGSLLTPAGPGALAAKVGVATEKLIYKQALKLGMKNSVAKAVASKIVPRAAGSAVEGAFYGAGQLVSEDALGKADLNAENLAAYIGTGALINGAFGAAFSTAGSLAGPAAKAAKFIASPFTSKISNAVDAKMSGARLLGLTPIQLQKLNVRNPKVAAGLEDYLKEDLKLVVTDTAESLLAKNSEMLQTSGAKIGSILNEVDAVLEAAPMFRPTSAAVWGNVKNKVAAQVADILETEIPGNEGSLRVIKNFMKKLDVLIKDPKDFNASQLQKVNQGLKQLLDYEKKPGSWTQLEDLAYTARIAIRDEIDLLAHTLQSRGLAEDLGRQLKIANRQYASSKSFGEYLEKSALKSADRDFSIINSAKDLGLNMSRKLVVLGKIERAQQAVTKAIDSSIKALAVPSRGLVLSTQAMIPSIVDSDLAKDYSAGKAKKPSDKQVAYNNILRNLDSYTQSPTGFLEKANRQTASIFNEAPETSAQLDQLAMTSMAYLSMKVPKRTANPTLFSAYKPAPLPSSQELAKFARILQAVEKPMEIFKNLQQGTVSREEIEVLKSVYPATYVELQDKLIQELPKLQATMPYNRRIQLGLLMGIPADASMLPANVLGLQGLFGQAAAEEQAGAVKQTVSGMSNLESMGPSETPLQEVQASNS